MLSTFFGLLVTIIGLIFSDPLDGLVTQHETDSGTDDKSGENVNWVMHIVGDSENVSDENLNTVGIRIPDLSGFRMVQTCLIHKWSAFEWTI